jgi:competence protein ComEC
LKKRWYGQQAYLFFRMSAPAVYFWKKSVFIRLLPALITGIILQWQINLPFLFLNSGMFFFLLFLVLYFFIPIRHRFRFSFLNGVACLLLFTCTGARLTYAQNLRNSDCWFGKYYSHSSALVVSAIEPPVIKEKSIKVLASVSEVIIGSEVLHTTGNILLYFDRNTPLSSLQYGKRFLFKKSLQEIRNSGNPGAFDYRRYCFFQGITHQVYLGQNEFIFLKETHRHPFQSFIFSLRQKIVSILKQYIRGEKETGLAEALLVGYKDDLDKSLVQAYSNTGVVHIIAISGLHLGLIYWLLVQLCKPLCRRKETIWVSPLIIISGLWLFSFLAGAQPSVLRSAVMFSCLALGEGLNRKTNIYNSLAFSAFILLCYNPYWLWDTGFQLSYVAVLSLVIFMNFIKNLFCFKSRLINAIWKLSAVTLAAQILTLPLCIYYFHQLPGCFLFTNLVAVPLSSIILMGEIILIVISVFPIAASIAGQLISFLTKCMNGFIEKIDVLPFATWGNLQVSLTQTIILLILIIGFSYWLMAKNLAGFKAGLICMLAFILLRSISFIASSGQKKIIIYNVPQKRAIDIIEGDRYQFIGDSSLQTGIARNYNLIPARTFFRSTRNAKIGITSESYLSWHGKHILMLDSSIKFKYSSNRPLIDILLISGKPSLTIKNLFVGLNIKQVVADASVPYWKAVLWKQECEELHIPWHYVSEKGAFAINLP